MKYLNLKSILGTITLFGLIGSISIFAIILFWASFNDYVLFEMNEVTENFADRGLISQDIKNTAIESLEQFIEMANYFDWFWLLFLVLFIGGSLGLSYIVRREDYYSFAGFLFFGIMISLFVVWIISTLTDWFISNIMFELIPNLDEAMPKFDWWRNHIGIISLIHLLACLFINQLDLKIFKNRKEDVLIDDEVL